MCRVPVAARRMCEAAGLPYRDGMHAAGHALLNVLPLFMMANPSDMRAECDNPYSTRYRPERILIYDAHPGGIGLAAKVCVLVVDTFACNASCALLGVCCTTIVQRAPGCQYASIAGPQQLTCRPRRCSRRCWKRH